MILNTIKYSILALTVSTLVGCGSSDNVSSATSSEMPESCQEYMAEIQDLMSENPEVADMFADIAKGLDDSWEDMSDDEKKDIEQGCVSGLKEIEELEK